MIQIEQTADGSQTLFVPELNEHYHSVKGALTESEHIFIQMGLKHSSVEAPHVLEIGFGTGLNAFLTLLTADTDQRNIHYTTLERYPVTPALIEQLTYPELICPERKDDFQALHQAAWNTDVQLTPYFTLHKVETDFTSYTFPATYDVPEMWTQPLFDTLYRQLNSQGILTTYCAKGAVRRMLQAAGFTVERLPGPPGGKREILRATKEKK